MDIQSHDGTSPPQGGISGMGLPAMQTHQLLTIALAVLDLIKPYGLSFVWQEFRGHPWLN